MRLARAPGNAYLSRGGPIYLVWGGCRICLEAGDHAKPVVGVFKKSIYETPCQFLAIDAHEMAPRTTHWLQERRWDAPTKGLAW